MSHLPRADGIAAYWQKVAASLIRDLGLDFAYFGVISDGVGHVCGTFPPAGTQRPQRFALAGTLTGWMTQHCSNAVAIASLQRDHRFAEVPHVQSGRVRSYAGAPFRLEDGLGFLSINGFNERGPFSPHEIETVAALAAQLRFAFQTELVDLWHSVRQNGAGVQHEILADLHDAIDKGQLTLYYQPYWDVVHSKAAGFEALVRWNHPRLGLVLPDDFVPAAEATGCIAEIGNWVRSHAFRWAARHLNGLDIGVNVSALEIDESFAQQVQRSIEQCAIDPRQVILEITESTAIQASTHAAEQLTRCANLGVRIAIDDFGAGYSMAHYLDRLPVHVVKVDRSIVRGIPERAVDASTALVALDMASQIGATVIAEGVETNEQLDWLSNHAYRVVQGFLIARPLPGELVERILLYEKREL